MLAEYLSCLDKLFATSTPRDLQRLFQVFEGRLEFEPQVSVVQGGPVFRGVVLPGELQPAEWPKYRYLLIELWQASHEKVQSLVETDRINGRKQVASSLYARKVRAYCEDKGIAPAELTKEARDGIVADSKAALEAFLSALQSKKVVIEKSLFEAELMPVAQADATPVADTGNGS
jgi:hypothetical protein